MVTGESLPSAKETDGKMIDETVNGTGSLDAYCMICDVITYVGAGGGDH